MMIIVKIKKLQPGPPKVMFWTINEVQCCLPAHSQASQQLVAQRLCLGNGTQATSGNLLSIQLKWGGKIQVICKICNIELVLMCFNSLHIHIYTEITLVLSEMSTFFRFLNEHIINMWLEPSHLITNFLSGFPSCRIFEKLQKQRFTIVVLFKNTALSANPHPSPPHCPLGSQTSSGPQRSTLWSFGPSLPAHSGSWKQLHRQL